MRQKTYLSLLGSFLFLTFSNGFSFTEKPRSAHDLEPLQKWAVKLSFRLEFSYVSKNNRWILFPKKDGVGILHTSTGAIENIGMERIDFADFQQRVLTVSDSEVMLLGEKVSLLSVGDGGELKSTVLGTATLPPNTRDTARSAHYNSLVLLTDEAVYQLKKDPFSFQEISLEANGPKKHLAPQDIDNGWLLLAAIKTKTEHNQPYDIVLHHLESGKTLYVEGNFDGPYSLDGYYLNLKLRGNTAAVYQSREGHSVNFIELNEGRVFKNPDPQNPLCYDFRDLSADGTKVLCYDRPTRFVHLDLLSKAVTAIVSSNGDGSAYFDPKSQKSVVLTTSPSELVIFSPGEALFKKPLYKSIKGNEGEKSKVIRYEVKKTGLSTGAVFLSQKYANDEEDKAPTGMMLDIATGKTLFESYEKGSPYDPTLLVNMDAVPVLHTFTWMNAGDIDEDDVPDARIKIMFPTDKVPFSIKMGQYFRWLPDESGLLVQSSNKVLELWGWRQ